MGKKMSLNPIRTYFMVYVGIVLSRLFYIFNQFTWLDHGDIQDGRAIVPLDSIHSIFISPFGSTYFYRPMVTFFHILDYALYHYNAAGYHFTNILLFAAIPIISLFFLECFTTFGKKEKITIFLITAFHPLSWLPVGSISYRPELLFVLFSMLSIIYYVRYRKNSIMFDRLLTLAFAFCAFVSKETAFLVVPAFIFVWERYHTQGAVKKNTRLIQFDIFLTIVIMICIRIAVIGNAWGRSGYTLSVSDRIGTTIEGLNRMISMLVVPLLPPLSDAITIHGIAHYHTMIFTIITGCILFIFFRFHQRNFRSLLILTIITLLPALNLIHLPRFVSPHYVFFTVIPFAGCVILLMRHISVPYKKFCMMVLFIWIIVAGFHTVLGGLRFRNDRTLFLPEVTRDQRFAEGHFYLGSYYFGNKNLQKAEQEYRLALAPSSNTIAYVDLFAVRYNLTLVQNLLRLQFER